jgi:peptidoglycan hydrolase-like protein with peptidoglycan-binding domain
MMIQRALRAGIAALLLLPLPLVAIAAPAGQSSADAPSLTATPSLIREIQFMLLSLGFDPGPLDGNARQLTNRAVHLFQQRSGLPDSDVVNNQPISPVFLEKLRQEVAQVLFKGTRPEAQGPVKAIAPPQTPPPQIPSPPTPLPAEASVAPPKPAPAPPDRFAACSYSPQDFLIGGQQYTPEAFLDEGFDGATSRAVANLRQRLEEARQIAEKIGGPALLEVQRQAHVLTYFECRQKIEQASTTGH